MSARRRATSGELAADSDALSGLRGAAPLLVLAVAAAAVVAVAGVASEVVTSSTSSAFSIKLVGMADSAAEVLSVDGLKPWAYWNAPPS